MSTSTRSESPPAETTTDAYMRTLRKQALAIVIIPSWKNTGNLEEARAEISRMALRQIGSRLQIYFEGVNLPRFSNELLVVHDEGEEALATASLIHDALGGQRPTDIACNMSEWWKESDQEKAISRLIQFLGKDHRFLFLISRPDSVRPMGAIRDAFPEVPDTGYISQPGTGFIFYPGAHFWEIINLPGHK